MDKTRGRQTSGLTSSEAQRLFEQWGPNEVADKPEGWPRRLAAKLWNPLAWMLEGAVLLEFLLGRVTQAGVVLGLLLFNAVLGISQESRANAAIAALRQKLALTASALRDGVWRRLPARDLVPGDVVKLTLGSVAPADVKLLDGGVSVDQSMLTGELLPVELEAGDATYAGALVQRGEAAAIVTATGARTFFGKTASLVQDARTVSSEQRVVLGVVRDLALINGAVVLAMFAYAHAIGLSLEDTTPLLLTALLASIPVALPSTFTLAAALSAHRLARASVLPTRLAAINEAAAMTLLCSDKTGTLTKNSLSIEEIAGFEGASEAQVLALAAAASSEGGDPIDQLICDAAKARGVPVAAAASFTPFDPAAKYAEARLTSGAVVRKGAITAVADAPLTEAQESARARLAAKGCRILAVAERDAGGGRLVGLIGLADPPRDDARALVAALRDMGVRVVMATGDAPETAAVVARQVGIEGELCDARTLRTLADPGNYGVFAGVFPADKFRLVQLFQRGGAVIGMCGDGANDAPALRQAQMGIAVASATDVAKAAAGLVLTEPGLGGILAAIREARAAFRRIRTYTLSMIVRKVAFVLYLALGLMMTGQAVLTPTLMVMLLIINDFLTMAVATDNAPSSPRPREWRVGRLMAEGGSYGALTLAYALALLLAGADLWRFNAPELQSLSFLALTLSVQASIYALREDRFLWSSAPSFWVVLATMASVGLSVALAGFGVLMAPLPLSAIGASVLGACALMLCLSLLKCAIARFFPEASSAAPSRG